MGILRSREELLPVTCAVLSDADRRDFFDKIKKKAGRLERVAQVCETSSSVVSDWASGKCLVPYQTLQRLAREFGVEPPQVSELRREYQPVSQVPSAPPPRSAPAAKPAARERKPPKAQAPRKAKAAPRPKQPRAPRRGEAKPKEQRRKASVPKAKPGKPGEVKYSVQLAYWAGATFAAGRLEGESLLLKAERRIGQNFAGAWARLTDALFGLKPALSMTEDRKEQIAALPAAALGDFPAKLGMKAGAGPSEAPAAPRWVWSNETWKSAFLKGVVDAAAHFHRTPSLKLVGLSEALRKSAHKILSSLGFAPKLTADQALTLEGAQDVGKYFDTVGTDNFKLRDQVAAYRKPRSGGAAPRPTAPDAEEDVSAQASAQAEQDEQDELPLPEAAPPADNED